MTGMAVQRYPGSARLSHWHGGGRLRQPLHRRFGTITAIRKVDSTGMITTVAGHGGGRLWRGWRSSHPSSARLFPLAWRWTARATSTSLIGANRRIRKVDSTGTITTVAGRGDDNVDPAYGFDGDGGPALRGLGSYHPTADVAVDGLGNLYIAESRQPQHSQGRFHGDDYQDCGGTV